MMCYMIVAKFCSRGTDSETAFTPELYVLGGSGVLISGLRSIVSVHQILMAWLQVSIVELPMNFQVRRTTFLAGFFPAVVWKPDVGKNGWTHNLRTRIPCTHASCGPPNRL